MDKLWEHESARKYIDPRVSAAVIARAMSVLEDANAIEGFSDLRWPLAAKLCGAVIDEYEKERGT